MRTEKLRSPIPLIKHYITIHFPSVSNHTSLGTSFRVSKRYMLCRISFIILHYMACFLQIKGACLLHQLLSRLQMYVRNQNILYLNRSVCTCYMKFFLAMQIAMSSPTFHIAKVTTMSYILLACLIRLVYLRGISLIQSYMQEHTITPVYVNACCTLMSTFMILVLCTLSCYKCLANLLSKDTSFITAKNNYHKAYEHLY